MDGFTKLPKMQHFKQGGGVKSAYCGGGKAYKKGGEVHDVADEKEDKKLIKKAFKMHDEQSHDEKTDLSKLKKGGRAKKDCGTVRKYKDGGIIGMKKTAEDKKEIANIKKMNTGGMSGAISDAAKRLKDNVMGTPEQNEAAKKSLDKVAEQPGVLGTIERTIRKGVNTPVTKKKGGKC